MNVASYDNYMLINLYLTFCFLLFAFFYDNLIQLGVNKVTGSDGILVRQLKETADQISPYLTMLFNKSLRLDIFPGDWKLANIVPIFFKKGKRDFV